MEFYSVICNQIETEISLPTYPNTAGVTLGESSPYINHTFEAIEYIEAGLKNKNTISEVKKYLDKLVRQMDKNNTNVIEVAKGLLYREMIKGKSKLS